MSNVSKLIKCTLSFLVGYTLWKVINERMKRNRLKKPRNKIMSDLTEIEQIRKLEDENYEISKKVLGDTYSLVNNIVELYVLLRKIISEPHTPPEDAVATGINFLLSCQYQLTISCLAILRGHFTDSFQSTRNAIESCAFSARIFKHPHLAKVWINAGDKDKSYEVYREKFSGKKIFPEDDLLLKDLKEDYDRCSKQIHSSIYNYSRRLDVESSEDKYKVEFQYFEFSPEDRGEPARTFLCTVVTHFKILRVFANLFKEEIKHNIVKWDVHYNSVYGKYGFHMNRWKDIITRL
jgi:hypothetical protein